MRTKTAVLLGLLTSLLLVFPVDAGGQDVEPDHPENPFVEISGTAARIRESASQLDTLTADEKAKIAASLQVIDANKLRYDQASASTKQDDTVATSSEKDSQEAKSKLEELRGSPVAEIEKNSSSEELAAEAKTLREKISKTRENLAAVDLRMGSRSSARQSLLTAIDQTNEKLVDRQGELAAIPGSDNSLLSTARKLEIQSDIWALEAERQSYVAQQRRIDAEDSTGLLRKRKDLLSLQLQRDQTRLQLVDEAISAAQVETAREMAKTAASDQSEISQRYPQLSFSYALNTILAEQVQKIEQEILTASSRQDTLTRQLTRLQKMRRETSKRVDKLGMTNAIGALLRKQKAELSLEMPTKVQSEIDKTTLDEIEYTRFELEEIRSETSIDSLLAEIESNLGKELTDQTIQDLRATASESSLEVLLNEVRPSDDRKLTEKELEKLESPIDDLLEARKRQLSSMIDALDRHYSELLDIQITEANLIEQTRDYREYINERILWIRSNKLLFSELEIDDSDFDAVRPSNWLDTCKKAINMIGEHLAASILSVLLMCGLFFSKPRLRNDIDRLGSEAAKASCDSSWPTIHAITMTILLALSAPMLPLLLGLGMFSQSPSGSTLFDSIGIALLATSFFAVPMEILRRMCRKNGVAKCHFYWPNTTIDRLRKHLDRLVLPGAILVFAVVLLRSMDAAHRVDLIERIVFVLAMALLGYFLYLTFSPDNGIFSSYLATHEKSWASQTSTLWFWLILMIPGALAGLAIWGFYYSALNLSVCLYVTLVFGLTAEIIRAFIRRMILLSRRRVHIENAKKKREQQLLKQKEAIKAREEARKALARAKADPNSEIDPESLMVPANVEIPTVESLVDLRPANDIDDNALRAKKLLSLVMVVVWAFGLWIIWLDVLPALKKLDSIKLWSNNVAILGSEAGSSGTAVPLVSDESRKSDPPGDTNAKTTPPVASTDVTVRDLLKFLAIAILTLVSARNLPGAIEMLFLDHLPIDRSFRYATKALISYAIVMLGMILAFNALSISWSKVQWLATALTFGLAFGLQEIFANFVAGIILMFERPIRIGDLVTVDDQTGLVSKIRTRATTIVNFDRKEYVIPNRDFITGRFVNWTLSDAVNRIVFTVGIAYGADVLKAKKILLEVCNNHPKTIADPPTSVIFDLFGDSSLNLTVRTFLADVDCRLAVTDDLHTQINQAFLETGIEISFPQRDLHIRSVDPSLSKAMLELSSNQKA